jgi:hypothetical protein
MNALPASSDLYLSVAINQGLRQVTEISHQINLVAMNAILVAKRAGEQSSGFRVVAMELRIFSQKMEDMMSQLEVMIFSLVRRIADLRKLEKNLRAIKATMTRGARAAEQFQGSFEIKNAAYLQLKEATDQQWFKLQKEMRRSLNLCSSGAMLSHNARIEAAYGGTMLADMQQVAGRIEDIMNQAIFELKHLTTTANNS